MVQLLPDLVTVQAVAESPSFMLADQVFRDRYLPSEVIKVKLFFAPALLTVQALIFAPVNMPSTSVTSTALMQPSSSLYTSAMA